MRPEVLRWKELAHRALDDAFGRETGRRLYPGGPLSEAELQEFLELDRKLGSPSEKVKEAIRTVAEGWGP
jgi:hypothetical protein